MLTEITNGTISFVHPHPPKGAHKTYAIWLDRKLEKFTPIQLGGEAYHQMVGAMYERGFDVLRERRSDNTLVAQVGDVVFSKSEYERRRAERIAAEQGAA